MRLEVAGRQALDSPGSNDIAQAVAHLDAGADYVRLCSDETTFIQFNGTILAARTPTIPGTAIPTGAMCQEPSARWATTVSAWRASTGRSRSCR